MSKIFIIDDDVNILFGLQAKINLAGHETRILNEKSIETTLEQIKISQPDYLVIEPHLNIFNGFSLLNQAKANNETAHIQIIIFSEIDNETNRELVKTLNPIHFFNKQELQIDDFVIKLSKIIKNHQRQKALYEN